MGDSRFKIGFAAYFLGRLNSAKNSTEMTGQREAPAEKQSQMPALADLVRDRQSLRFLHDDRAGHFGMNRAKIVVSARSAGCNCELLICVERSRFLKLLLDADNGVRFFVPIDPRDLLPGFHRQGLGAKIKVLDYNLIVPGARGRGFLLTLAESKVGQEQEADGKNNC
jgi:hypothetical protein